MLNNPFKARSALVTGASSGLGVHFATLLGRQGIGTLFLAARRADRLQQTAALCAAAGAGRVITLDLDVTDPATISVAFKRIADEGGLDLLVNNAGVADTAPALETSLESYDRVMDTNLRGVWICAVEAAKIMKGANGGDIVNIASILGLRVANNVAPYAISKAGVVQMTRALALEWARYGIRVNALAPGYVSTEINAEFFASDAGSAAAKRIPMRRIGTFEDLDAPFLLLASGSSAYLTGVILPVDGGHHINTL
jgi:NAD(P)-dependent dehydrogenase (short-subunit alcohol dehydrogenase family)